MLNELQQLRRGLAEAKVSLLQRHPDVKSLGKHRILQIRLSKEPHIASVEVMSSDMVESSWTIRDGQQNSFPALVFRTNKDEDDKHLPLLNVASEDPRVEMALDEKAKFSDRINALVALAEESELNEAAIAGWPSDGFLGRLSERQSQIRALEQAPACGCVPAVFERFLKLCEQPTSLLQNLVEILLKSLQEKGTDPILDMVIGLLLKGELRTYFDVLDSEFEYDVCFPQCIGPVSQAISLATTDQDHDGQCALTGHRVPLVGDKFPQPNLPRLGQTYLFARNKDIPCSHRYGRYGSDSMSVGLETATSVHGAVEAITQAEWKGKTWDDAPSELPKQWDLLVSFIDGNTDLHIANLLTTDMDESGKIPADFRAKTELLTAALRGKLRGQKQEPKLRVVVLRQVDTANRKAVFRDTIPVSRLLDAAKRWSDACNSIPPVRRPLPVGKGKPAVRVKIISPAALVPISKSQFIRGGTERQEIIGGTYSDALSVFWDDAPVGYRKALKWLRLLIRRHHQLLQGLGQALSGDSAELLKFFPKRALESVAALHVLLNKIGRNGEIYMNDAAYQLGQLLAAADTLHRGYCADVRNGQIPSRLIGNAAIAMAGANPIRALSVLERRWPVYQAWAEKKNYYHAVEDRLNKPYAELKSKAEKDEKANQEAIRAGASIARYIKPLANALHGKLSGPTTDAFRAELLLGYVAGPQFEELRSNPKSLNKKDTEA